MFMATSATSPGTIGVLGDLSLVQLDGGSEGDSKDDHEKDDQHSDSIYGQA